MMRDAVLVLTLIFFCSSCASELSLPVSISVRHSFPHIISLAYPTYRHHRLLLVTELSPTDLASEVEFIHTSLLPDPKNYHTWAYLHWLYSHFSELGRITPAMWAAELAWCESLIADDGRNNSAWGWRWFLRMAWPDAAGAADPTSELG
jgi:protein farnesyltransferase/geranylgeranyltransferase type-1 subunit alpha